MAYKIPTDALALEILRDKIRGHISVAGTAIEDVLHHLNLDDVARAKDEAATALKNMEELNAAFTELLYGVGDAKS